MRKLLPVFFACAALSFSAFAQTKTSVPDFSVTTIDGKTYNSDNLRGKIVVINLWFINCPNCLEEIGLLNKLTADYQSQKDVVFLALATNNKTELQKFLEKHPFKYQIVSDAANTILSKFGTPDKNGQIEIPFPVHIIIDREGKMLVKVYGIKGAEAVKNELKKQFAGK